MSLYRLSRLLRSRQPRPVARDRRRNRRGATVEVLEGRQLLSVNTAPLTEDGVSVPTYTSVNFAPVSGWDLTVPSYDFSPMENTVVDGIMSPTQFNGYAVRGDVFQVNLTKGQTIEAMLDVTYNISSGIFGTLQSGQHNAQLAVTDPNGNLIINAFTNGSNALVPGGASNNPEAIFTAPATGSYTFNVNALSPSSSVAPSITQFSYAAAIRPFALDTTADSALDPNHSAADAAKLSFTGGGLYGWYSTLSDSIDPTVGSATATPGYFTFSGPTGRGFDLKGNWAEQVNIDGTLTYSANGVVRLESALGEIPLPLVKGTSFTVTTNRIDGSRSVGFVTGAQINIDGLPINSFTNVLSNFNFATNLGGGSVGTQFAEASWGIDLGGNVSAQTGAPANPAVPYIYFAANAPVSVHYGNITASADATGVGAGVNVSIDPADPMIYVDIKGLPAVSELAFAGSVNDLIPYNPQYAPNDWTGSLYGDVYFKGELNLGDLTDDAVPVTIDGDLTVNLDPNHVGFGASAKNIAQDFARAVTPGTASASALTRLRTDIKSISFGLDGSASLGIKKDGLDFEVPMGGASLIWNGQTDTVYVHGQANTLNNGLPSILALESDVTVDAMIVVDTGAFDFTLGAEYKVLGLDLTGSVEVSSTGITLTAGLSYDTGEIGVSGFECEASGYVDVTLAFDYQGDVTFGFGAGIHASYDFLGYSGSWDGSFSFTETVNLVALGSSLWNDIKNELRNDLESQLGF
jgi:hypothetical protein